MQLPLRRYIAPVSFGTQRLRDMLYNLRDAIEPFGLSWRLERVTEHLHELEPRLRECEQRLQRLERIVEGLDEEVRSGEVAMPAIDLLGEIEEKLEQFEPRIHQLEFLVARHGNQLHALLNRNIDNPLEPVDDASHYPKTIEESLKYARESFGDILIFGDQIDEGIQDLRDISSMSRKIFSHLCKLAEAGRLRRQGNLRWPIAEWMDRQGYPAGFESKTVRNSEKERAKRTWHVDGEAHYFDEHLKPTRGTHPDRCVRIYYKWDEARQCILVGWIGRHP